MSKSNQAILEATTEPKGERLRERLRVFSTTRMVQLHIDRRQRRSDGPVRPDGGDGASRQPVALRSPGELAAAKRAAEAEDQWEELRSQSPFGELGPAGREQIMALLRAGRAQYLALPRDQLVAASGQAIWVLAGQVVVAVMDRSLLRELGGGQGSGQPAGTGPILSRRVRQNLAYFQAGDLLETASLARLFGSPLAAYPDCELGVYTLSHAALFLSEAGALGEAGLGEGGPGQATIDTGLRAARERAQATARSRLPQALGATAGAMDYFIRHGLPLADRVRLLDLSQCIGCGACEATCAELYGRNRLHLSAGPAFYTLKTIGTCRTCSDQRCVTACAYDAIHFIPEKSEVKIDEYACIGCSACSTACPYNAIEMRQTHPATPFGQKLQARLDAGSDLVQIRSRRSVADPSRTRIASKCDHCETHGGQQACVAVCPGGALTLSEYSPAQALHALSAQERAASPSLSLSSPVVTAAPTRLLPAKDLPPLPEAVAPRAGGNLPAREPAWQRWLGWIWLAGVLLALLGAGEFLLQKTALIPSLRSLFGIFGGRPLWASHALRLAFGWSGLGAAFLAGLFALRRAYLRRPAAVVATESRLRSIVRRLLLQGLGDFRLHSLAGGFSGLLIAVHAWFPWRSLAGITAGLGLFLLVVSGVAIRALSSRLRARRAIVETELSGLRREAERLRLTPSLVEAGEALLQRLCPAPPPRLGTGFFTALFSLLSAFFDGLWLWLLPPPAALQGLYSKSEAPDIVAQYRHNLQERWRRQRRLQLLPTLEAGAELARLIHLPLSLIFGVAVLVHVCEKYGLF